MDDVLTHAAFRGRHFGTRLISCLVGHHSRRSDNLLYLFASNPIAVRMYRKAGFRQIPMAPPYWAGHLSKPGMEQGR